MKHDEMIAVIQHHKNGGEVEVAHKSGKVWETTLRPCWDFQSFNYRPKPEPMVLWGIYDRHGFLTAETTEDHAKGKASKMIADTTIKKFIEATE